MVMKSQKFNTRCTTTWLVFNIGPGYLHKNAFSECRNLLQLQVQSCETALQLICDKLTLAFNDLSKGHFCSGAEIAVHCD